MTEYELNEFQSDFDPQAMADGLKEDHSPKNKLQHFARLNTAAFLVFSRAPGKVSVLNTKKKEAFIAAFTCREELEKWPFDRETVAEMTFANLRRLVDADPRLDGLVINPFGKALFLRRPHFSDMDNTLRAAQPRKELKLKATLDYPMGLPLAVRQLMADHPEVYRVWLVAAHSEGETVDHKLFIVDFDGKPESIFPKLAEAVRLYMRQGESFEMMKADIRLLRVAEQAARPIYEKA